MTISRLGGEGVKYDLPARVEADIIKLAQKNGVEKVILFGSRARGDNRERSDIDLAARGGNILDFYYDLEEEAWTLLFFDVVDLGEHVSAELKSEIQRDGVLLYEKV